MTKDLPGRKRMRLPDFDYSRAGYYFVTVCARERRCVFGEVTCASDNGSVGAGVLTRPWVALSEIGMAVDGLLSSMVYVDKYIVMPNHVHIIFRNQSGEEGGRVRTPAPTAAIPGLVRYFKRAASVRCGTPLWQRGYYDHIIRDEADYKRIWQYVDDNPAKWAEDEYFPRESCGRWPPPSPVIPPPSGLKDSPETHQNSPRCE